MSQFYQTSADSNIPVDVPTMFVTDNGTAIPSAHVLNVLGGPGISTSGSGNTVIVKLENGCSGTTTTTDATPTQITCLSLGATPGTYFMRTQVAAYSTAPSNLGAGYFITAVVRTDGTTGVVIGIPDKMVFEEGDLVPANCTVSTSGNNFVIVVTGVAGYTIDWRELTTGTFVG